MDDRKRTRNGAYETLEELRSKRKVVADFRKLELKGDDVIEDEWSSSEGRGESPCRSTTNTGTGGQVVVRATDVQYTRIDNDTAVLYIPISTQQSGEELDSKYKTFGLRYEPYQIAGDGQQCLTMPVYNDKYKGMSQMMGLTGRCVCLVCLAALIKEAKNKNEEVSRYVYAQTTVPYSIEMRQMHTPGWVEENGTN